jgi:hypothetical protein
VKLRASLLLGIVLVATPAWAEPTVSEAELATARALFEEGLAREDAKDYTGALERFKRVAEIRVTAQVLYNMALCYERLGKTATADTFYGRVIEKGGAPDLVKLATHRRAELKNKVPEITLEAPLELALTLDGSSVTAGTPIAIDPGPHEVVARRGADTARKTFEVTSGKITIAVPAPAPEPTPPPPPPPSRERRFPALAFVTGGVALAGAGVGIFGAVSRASTIGDLDAACGSGRDQCPESAHDDLDTLKTQTLLANVGFSVAIVATLVTAGIVYFGYVRKPATSAGGIPPLLGPIRF